MAVPPTAHDGFMLRFEMTAVANLLAHLLSPRSASRECTMMVPRAFRRCKARPPSRGARRFIDEIAAENADPGAGSNLGLPAASGGDAGAQPVEERAGDVPSGAGGPEPS